jgi:hypothetical protein
VATSIRDRSIERERLPIDEREFHAWVEGVLIRHPAVGLAVGVVRDGSLDLFRGRGLADVAPRTPITEGTVFRIGSITKLFTAIAVMQLEEDGLVDLDTPASEYLRAYRLIPVDPSFPPVTLRHLLTHTAGIPEVRHVLDLVHPEAGPFGGRPVLCGRYRLLPKISDLRGRLALPAGVEVFVRGGHQMIRALVPVPALYRGLPLHPDDEDDPTVFRLDLSSLGMSTVRVVFGTDAATGRTAIHLDLGGQPLSLVRTGRRRAERSGVTGR